MSVPIIKDIIRAYRIPILEVQGYDLFEIDDPVILYVAHINLPVDGVIYQIGGGIFHLSFRQRADRTMEFGSEQDQNERPDYHKKDQYSE